MAVADNLTITNEELAQRGITPIGWKPPAFRVELIKTHAKPPAKANLQAAAYDLFTPENLLLPAETQKTVMLGIKTEIPQGWYGQIFDRSGLAHKNGIHVMGGVIDCDYRGEWGVILRNLSRNWKQFSIGDRIAQVVLLPYGSFPVVTVDSVDNTERGAGGFGSTGK